MRYERDVMSVEEQSADRGRDPAAGADDEVKQWARSAAAGDGAHHGFLSQADQLLEDMARRLEEAREELRRRQEEERRRKEEERRRLEEAFRDVEERLNRLQEIRRGFGELEQEVPEELEKLATRLRLLREELVQQLGFDPLKRERQEKRRAERTAELRRRISEIQNPSQVQNVANEIIQGLPILGLETAQALHDDLERVLQERGIAPTDLVFRLEEHLARLRGAGGGAAESPPGEGLAGEPAERMAEHEQRVASLLREVENQVPGLAYLTKEEILAQINIWAGRGRILQQEGPVVSPAAEKMFRRLFGILTQASKELQPGWTPALNRRSQCDWVSFVRANEEALEEARRRRRLEAQRREQELAETAHRREEALRQLDALRVAVDRIEGPDAEEVRGIVKACLAVMPASDPRLLGLLRPLGESVGEILSGREFRRVRRALGLREQAPPRSPDPEVSRLFAVLREKLEGARLTIIGGYERPEVRRSLEEGLSLGHLRWVTSEANQLPDFGALATSLRQGGTDAVIVLTDFCGHSAETLRPVCDTLSVPFVRVGNGCGLLRILQSLERVLCPAEDGPEAESAATESGGVP
jgi:hypothetical protein